MKKVIKYGIIALLIGWFLANLIPNFLTVRVNVCDTVWSIWTIPDYVPEADETESTEPQWTEYTLRCGDRVEFEGWYDVSFVVKDIDLFSITIKCEPNLTEINDYGRYNAYDNGRAYFIIPRSEIVKLTTPTIDSGETIEIDYLGFD